MAILFGNLPIANMYFGTRQVKKVYLGNTLVWEKEETGYTLTISGAFDYTIADYLASKVTIDNITCSTDYLGNMTNIPHTFTNVASFEILPNHDSGKCAFKVISGSGYFSNGSYTNEPYVAGTEMNDMYSGSITITMTSDTVIQLGYHED